MSRIYLSAKNDMTSTISKLLFYSIISAGKFRLPEVLSSLENFNFFCLAYLEMHEKYRKIIFKLFSVGLFGFLCVCSDSQTHDYS